MFLSAADKNPALWQRIENTYDELIDLSEAQQSAALDIIDDLVLRTEVAALLISNRKIGNFLVPKLSAESLLEEAPLACGTRIGAWRLLSLLGRGGMGAVYRAERADGLYQQQVALKLARIEAVSHSGQFHNERQILATLEHPGIARLIDGGFTADRCPYMVMELVEGLDFIRYCRETSLGLRQRLALFMQVCEAVGYAHEHRVIHRDIKPRNILVTSQVRVKLLDFGIAKLLDAGNLASSGQTGSLMTPDYAAPEQLEGQPVTPATDVFALGVLLYELLTDRLPWNLHELPLPAALQRMLQSNARRPSEIAAEANAPPVPAQLLRGDLDAIVLKALRQEPRERYGSATELWDDVQRHLSVEPVRARGGARSYRIRKFARRYRVVLLFTAALFIALMANGLTISGFFKPGDGSEDRSAFSTTDSKSIAVLPFANLSADKDNAYFVEGIREEVLTRLTRIETLKVISRNSTQSYASDPDNPAEIAKQLGVANILEGRVQKAGDSIRINVRLIKAEDDSQLWAETFDRKLDNVLDVESEVATTIANVLSIKISEAEKAELAERPTQNTDAYDDYLRGVALFSRPDPTMDDLHGAANSLQTATQLDPDFALAWLMLARVNSAIFMGSGSVNSPTLRAAAQMPLENALRLRPDLPEIQLTQAYYVYQVERDYPRARQILQQILLKSPNNPEALFAQALIARRLGNWDESIADFNKSIELDPRDPEAIMVAAHTHLTMRQPALALKRADQVLDMVPGDPSAIVVKALTYQSMGQLDRAEAVLATVNPEQASDVFNDALAYQRLLQHRYAEGLEFMQSPRMKIHPGPSFYYYFTLGEFQRLSGDTTAARVSYQQELEQTQKAAKELPGNARRLLYLALAHAKLGNRDAAVDYSRKVIALVPSSEDALSGPYLEEILARIQAGFGEKEAAIAGLTHLLSVPYCDDYSPVTPALLRLDPAWDNLRDDPRFQKLIAADNEVALQTQAQP